MLHHSYCLVYLTYNFNTTSKSSAYDSNLTLVILEMQWNSCSLTYNLTILTKLSLYHKKKNTQTMFMALMP